MKAFLTGPARNIYAVRGGTHGELTLAHHLEKPVHLVLQVPIEEVSSWILGCATEVHADFQALRDRLRGL